MADLRVSQLPVIATEADMKHGNYFLIDGFGSPKLPAELVATRSVQDKLVDSTSESLSFEITGKGATAIHKIINRKIKSGSKIIISGIDWNPLSSGYPIRFYGYRKDGTAWSSGFGYAAFSDINSSGVYVITATDDAEYLDFVLTATNGTTNKLTVSFADVYENVNGYKTISIYGAVNSGYSTATRSQYRFNVVKGRIYDVSFSSSFSSSILSSSSLLVGVFVYKKDGSRRSIIYVNNNGANVPLHNYLYVDYDEDYVYVDLALDVGSTLTIDVNDITERCAFLKSSIFKMGNLDAYNDGPFPSYEFVFTVNTDRCVSLPAFLIRLEAGCIITSKKRDFSYKVLFFDSTGAQTSSINYKSVSVSADSDCLIAIINSVTTELNELVGGTFIICPSAASAARVKKNIESLGPVDDESKKFFAMKSINHRGYNSVAPENTLPAFRLSAVHGFDAIETDVRKSSDGYYVCCHDATVNRTSNGTGYVADMTLADLKALDFGSWKSSDYAGTKIPTLRETLDCCFNLGIGAVLEIKIDGHFDDIKNILQIIKDAKMEKNVAIISFSAVALRQFAMINNDIPLGFLSGDAEIPSSFKNRILSYNNGSRRITAVRLYTVNLTSGELEWLNSNGFGIERYAPNTDSDVLAVAPTAVGIISDSINARDLLRSTEIGE